MSLSPSQLQVLIAGLGGVAEEVGAVLQRSAFSPNIKERADCSAAVFSADGSLLAQAEHIPVHLGSMPASVAAVIEELGDRLGPGDQAIVNDPYRGGTHLNDVTVVAPCHVDGRLVGWVANRAHHADVGGAAPGSLPADATEIHQEGLRIPPVLLTAEVRELLLSASRTPWERAGDLDAQVGANVVGVRRLARFAGAPFEEVLAHGERRCRAALAAAPQGSWAATDVLDSTGPAADQQRPATVACRVTIGDGEGDRSGEGPAIRFDFTGTDDQRAGNTNAVRAVTVSAVAFVLRSVLDPTLPANAGVMRPVEVVAPEGSLVAARFPAAVGAGNVEVSQRIVDVCLRALAGAMPERVPAASQGTMNNLLVGSSGAGPSGAGEPWVYYETVGGGQGGRPPAPGQIGARPLPGMSGIHTGMTNTRNTPVEALERSYGMRVRAVRLWPSGGDGAAPGGDGIERELEVLEDVTVSLITERRVSRPWGLAGGEPGACGENWLLPGGDEDRAERLGDKCTIRLRAGDVLRMRTPGGGGWGAPPLRASGR
ncbi:hydantoinase B/oxoprolinase family protein [Dermatobacter hominis]|uniref:hydantoinase B/oxoprolinase family protein n=1 Tax=Dermatobacter hominis TaxID=2884263 RepID=UPI001D12862C|nr:hydantoinase B/oxoprolinase family protein [Dermatobacter hominis]UDY35519.1 hydantoinase B/oxoprolinase family protein [Dermatobacter hominis]